MPHKERNTRKKRGSRTHGYGRIGQHRGGGQRGGHGNVGFDKHKWTYTVKYDPDRFGKKGFKPRMGKAVIAINVGELDEQIDGLLEKNQAEKTKQGIRVHLDRLGYSKLLGRGKVTHPLIIQVDAYSESAAKKIEEAGGKILEKE